MENDLISRKAVLELPRNVERTFFGEVVSETVDVKAIEALPTIKPRKGKWLPDNNSVYEMRFVCSECNESQVVPTTGFTKHKPIWNFCPNCGADMREVTP